MSYNVAAYSPTRKMWAFSLTLKAQPHGKGWGIPHGLEPGYQRAIDRVFLSGDEEYPVMRTVVLWSEEEAVIIPHALVSALHDDPLLALFLYERRLSDQEASGRYAAPSWGELRSLCAAQDWRGASCIAVALAVSSAQEEGNAALRYYTEARDRACRRSHD